MNPQASVHGNTIMAPPSLAHLAPPNWEQQILEFQERLDWLEGELGLAHSETIVAQRNEAALRDNVRSLQNDLNINAASKRAPSLSAPSPSNQYDSSSEEVILGQNKIVVL